MGQICTGKCPVLVMQLYWGTLKKNRRAKRIGSEDRPGDNVLTIREGGEGRYR